MSEHDGGGDFKFLLGLFLGGLIGAFTIFFLGTKEGKRIGKELEEKGKDALDDLGDKVADIEKKGERLVEEAGEIKEKVVEKVEEKKEELTQSATEKLDTTLAQIEELQAQGQQTTAELRKRLFRNTPSRRR